MSFMKLLRLILFALLFITCTVDAQQQRPNIIFFLVDDMGWQDCSLPFWNKKTPLNMIFRTPNMERLAAQGMKFTNAYSNPVCTPTRVSLMTGMNVARHNVTNWTNVKKNVQTDKPDSVLVPPNWNYNGMTPVEGINNAVLATPLPALLKQAGYHTIHCGKAHFAPNGTPASNPLTLGFDINIAGTGAAQPGSFLAKDHYRRDSNDTLWGVRGLDKHIAKGTFLTDALTEEAIAAMQANETTGRPFFLYMAHYAVHVPYSKDDRFYQHYIDKGLTDTEAKYAALVEGMDKSLGELMDYLKQSGQEKNTYLVFMSDNGSLTMVPPRSGTVNTQNLPLKQGKGSVYEGGIRIPMIVAGPGIQSNTTNHQYVSIDDWFPTILELAGSKTYRTVQTIDGKSILPFLKNLNRKDDNKILLWHYPNSWTNLNFHGTNWGTALRKGDWKLIYFHRTGTLELYDLSKDIGEEHDLAKVEPVKLREMASLMTSTLKKRNASMPTFKQTGKQIPWPDESLLQLLNQAEYNLKNTQ